MTPAARDRWLVEAAERLGTPCFVYFADAIAQRAVRLRNAFQNRFTLSFAVKSNPNPALLAWLREQVDWLDVSSIGEMRLALAAGWDPARLGFTGPAKRHAEIREAVAAGIGLLIVESVREARIADAAAAATGRRQEVLVRISPAVVPRGFGDRMAGQPSAFGIDWEDTARDLPSILALPRLRVAGFHIYAATQCLRADAVVENYRGCIALFRELCARHAIEAPTLIFGSGLGIPYHDGDAAIDLEAVGAAVLPDLDACRADTGAGRLVLELGRYLVGEAGFFVTGVVATKLSRGRHIALCDGGMNNNLPASGNFGMVIRRNYRMHKVGGGDAEQPVDVVGPLCTSIDRLGSAVLLPPLDEGDLIAVHNAGAYGLTASPVHFIGHPCPAEAMVCDNRLLDVSQRFGPAEPAYPAPAIVERLTVVA